MANWKITTGYSIGIPRLQQPAAPIDYGITVVTIASVANEQTRPSNAVYVAKWGNNTAGNGSRDRPYLTISAANTHFGIQTGCILVLGSGVYRESLTVSNTQSFIAIIGDGDVTLDGTGIANLLTNSNNTNTLFVGLKIRNHLNVGRPQAMACTSYINCKIDTCDSVYATSEGFLQGNTVSNCVKMTFDTSTVTGASGLIAFSRDKKNNTFVNIKNVLVSTNTPIFYNLYNIYKNCNIQHRFATATDYNLYHNCNFRFNATAGTQPVGLPEYSGNTYVPSGWMATRPTTPAAIQAGQVAAGFAGAGFANSLMSDPLFNNISLGDFTLQSTSPARNLAYEGTFVGAKSVGTPLVFRTIQANGNWNNSGATNLTVVDDSATLTTDSTAVIESNVIDLGKDKVLIAISMLGLLGDRNGEWVDSSTDLDSVTTASGSNLLIVNQSYIVETGTITYNGVLYQVGQKFAVISGTLDYTPTGGGVVRKIIEAPNRVCYEMRISSISSADCSSATYFKYEFEVQPTANKVGNVSSGAITLGNGEITFNRTPANVFLLSARWIQIRLNVQNNNLV